MSSGLDHRECLESLAVYALGALPDEEADRVRQHLVTCHECRAELTWLRGAVDALPASVEPVEPPRELRDRLMEIVDSEAALLRAAGEAADRPPPARVPRRRRWLPRLGVTGAFAAAAVALVLVLALSSGSGTRVIRAQILQPLSGPIFATLRLDGTRAQLQVHGLPLPPAGHVDELWVQQSGGASPRPAGTFVLKSGSVDLLRPVRSGDLVLVTVEPGRGTGAPTTAPVIRARA